VSGRRERERGGGSSIINAFRSAIIIGATNARQLKERNNNQKKVPDVFFEKIKTMVGATENHHLQKGNPKKFRRKKRRQSSYSSVNFRFRTKFPVFIWGLFYFSDQT
jgi:hypothetical protein